ncbi:MAG: ACP S-malonyltransferase [Gammaproteobacteria bacterium]|nr:ACP S-malonyltransferase [Gammaproteobacteria bacterium]
MSVAANLGLVFPGQGSQSIGMLAELAAIHPVVRATFDEASAAVGRNLWALAQDGPEEELNRTINTQPALLAAGVAVWRAWQEQGGPDPALLAGHSLGEFTALVCAGSLELSVAAALVAHRGRLMQEAVPEGAGAMAAILGMDDADVERICVDASDGLTVAAANFNAPGQVVIAGDREAVSRAMELARGLGAKRVVPLPVSVPSHCALMKPAARKFGSRLESARIVDARIPVVQNVDAEARTQAGPITSALVRQLYQPVRWVDVIRTMCARGIARIVECGPGKVLTGLTRRIERGIEVGTACDPEGFEAQLKGAQR